MKTLARLAALALLPALVLLPAIAAAAPDMGPSWVDPSNPSAVIAAPVGSAPVSMWAMLATVLCALASLFVKRWAPEETFFKGKIGTLVLAMLSAVISAIQPIVAGGILNVRVLAMAAMGAIMSVIAQTDSTKQRDGLRAIAFLVTIPLLGACLPPLSECKVPSPVNAAKCKLEKNLIACGATAGINLLPIVLDIVVGAIGGHFDAGVLVAQLEAQGFKDIPCVLAALEDYLLPVAPELARHVDAMLVLKMEKDGHHGPFEVKLKSGRVVGGVAR